MFKNYLTTAFRALNRQRTYSLLNILGLAAGIACTLLIWLWVQDELGFDRFHRNAARLYRIQTEQNNNASTPYPFAPAIRDGIPAVAAVSRVGNPGTVLVQAGEKSFYETAIRAVDPAFLRMFTFPVVAGRPDDPLGEPFSIVISRGMAAKYFRGEDPIGQTLTMNKEFALTVTGIMKDPPSNSSLQPQFLVHVDRMDDLRETRAYWKNIDRWDLGAFQTWVELREGASAEDVGRQVTAIYDANTAWNRVPRRLMPLTGIRLTSSRSQIILFSGLALFVLLVACINFMNLATARAAGRAREIGLRKVSGASRRHVAVQFYGETFLTTLFAFFAAAALFMAVFPAFQRISGKPIGLDAILNGRFALGVLAILLLTSLAAGSYPALLLSGLRPVRTLKGQWRAGTGAAAFRKTLVVFQFALSAFLLIGTGVIARQVDHARTLNPGYRKDNLVMVPLRDDTAATYPALKDALRVNPLVAGVTASFQPPTNNGMRETGTQWEGKAPFNSDDPQANPYVFYDAVDYDYAETLGLSFAAGRSFSRETGSDAGGAFLINERMAKQMGAASPADAVGRILSAWRQTGPIVGVLEDYQFQSAESAIEPQVLSLGWDKLRFAVFRLEGGRIREALDGIQAAWRKINPGHPFEYRFFDEAFDLMYREDERLGRMITAFAVMGVLIAGLGLFGLASFSAAQRTKELGIRKILGASTPRLALLLGRDFLVWVALANVLAWPAAFLAAEKWTAKYAFRPPFGWWLYPAAAAASLLVAVVAVGVQSFKAATSDPVESLKYE
jgi:putative ABC transport system permease protein